MSPRPVTIRKMKVVYEYLKNFGVLIRLVLSGEQFAGAKDYLPIWQVRLRWSLLLYIDATVGAMHYT